ncbi:MAG: hypothetical protein AB8B49_07675 [Nitratireductor sp.]
MTNFSASFVGILSGLAAGLMVLAVLNSGALSYPLIFLTPIAIYLASMGWGNKAGIFAAIFGCGLCFLLGSVEIAIAAACLIIGPAVWIGHLTNLGRQNTVIEGEEAGTEWYPVSNIFLQLSIIIGIISLVFVSMVDFQSEQTVEQLTQMMRAVALKNPELDMPSDEDIVKTLALFTKLVPILSGFIWLFTHATNACIAATITQRSGVLARAHEDIASSLMLHRAILPVTIGACLGLYYGDGLIAQICGVIFGVCLASFALVGLAGAHINLNRNNGAFFILALIYASIFIFLMPVIFFIVTGIVRFFTMGSIGPSINHPKF